MKILVTGASGMLAAEVVPALERNGHTVIATDLIPRLSYIRKLDVCDADKVRKEILLNNPDFVFHLAAETNVDFCQQDPDHAFRVNTLGTENIALTCQQMDIPMVYISTAAVFQGDQKKPYTEFDIPNPCNTYGQSKWQGEIIVRDLLTKYFILRAGWMVGGWEIDKKFVYKIAQQIESGKTELTVVNDKFGSPTFTFDFAESLLTLVKSGRYGIYHLANKGACSRYDIALKIVEFMGCSDSVEVKPISSKQFPLPAPRGDSEMLRNFKLDLLGMNQMPHWEESLSDYIKIHKPEKIVG
jgi:dTDP-4-dehydrorhamnose reductase